MEEPEFVQNYLQYVDERVRWHKREADRTMLQYISLRLGMVLFSASLPALTVLDNRTWAIMASIVVAALTGLDTQFQWGEEWRHFRSGQLALERARRDYDRRKYEIESGYADAALGGEIFSMLCTEVEGLLQTETERFFKFRITPWKGQAGRAA